MRTNRRKNHYSQARINDRTAGAQCICRRTRRRRDDQTVRTILAEPLAFGGNFELQHPRDRTSVEDHVVEREEALHDFRAATRAAAYLGLQRDPAIGFIVTSKNALERLPRLAGARFGKKTETAQVDAKNRGLTL